jgi:hypothetical protein|uniref:Uncharacterized protein n=1 Tax=Zea mays TaxID=4577 RepID=B6TV64_MAIZE|nr:hypothetical protein [Zea mays]
MYHVHVRLVLGETAGCAPPPRLAMGEKLELAQRMEEGCDEVRRGLIFVHARARASIVTR